MRLAILLVLAGCQSELPVKDTPPVRPAPVVSDAAVPDAPISTATPIAPVAMDGPYKTIAEACHHAAPCGFTDMDEIGRMRSPATKTSCPALENDQRVDPNANDPRSGVNMKQLSHTTGDLALRIGSQRCAAPEGLRAEQDIYYMFVKRGDGWWRSAPLWQWSYNDKYGGGWMTVRWNDKPSERSARSGAEGAAKVVDRPGRTFAGIAASLTGLACTKQATTTQTIELMVRVEQGTKSPIVFAPLVVGERTKLELDGDVSVECKPNHHSWELTESWKSDDELELTGPAEWLAPARDRDTGLLTIELDDKAPSTAGSYRFAR